ncbi:MAG TPA: OmpH family outer membrane protein [Sphingomicrobium sp.]|nr:OmpH family outer membrane protein [Sphingomicrobium sp.]
MKTLLISAALAASILAPAAANAQAVPGAVIAVVDLERVTAECNACRTAQAALRSQATAFENERKSFGTSLQTERTSIQAAVDALKGKDPDAALQARIKAFQTKTQQDEQQLQARQQQISRNQQYIQKQVADKLNPIYQQVMQRRGANILLETGSTLATSTSVDVTNDVLAGLNASLPSIVTQAPAAAQPQGR